MPDIAEELCKINNRNTQNSTLFLSYTLQQMQQYCITLLVRFYPLMFIMDCNILKTLKACALHLTH